MTNFEESMKIAFVYDAVYPYRVGGVEKRIAELSQQLARRGHEVHIFGLIAWEGSPSFTRGGVHYHGVGKTCPFYTEGRRSIREALYLAVKVFSPLVSEPFDIIDCQNFPYLHCFPVALAAEMRKSRLVVTWHEVWGNYWYEYLGTFGFFGCMIERFTSRLSDKAIAVSKATCMDLHTLNNRMDISLIPNGIDINHIKDVPPSEIRSEIIYSGRLIREKNIDLLIESLVFVKEELPTVRCIIAGDGPENSRLQNRAIDLGVSDNIRFLGFIRDHNDVLALMKSSRVFASPSVREGFGIAPLEAMACGLPVVTGDARMNAVRELVNNKTGTISQLSPEKFAESIISCIDRSDKMRGSCISFAADYDWDVIAGNLESFYLDILRG
jgi:glycosyltransferase involved in cell wall biosynthesis